ncbi:MAG: flagellar basal-body MS-ring/collar protein FliF [Elusimicrobiales bacterium]|nr:flagellar basal-body MS-ring/collar protein FliF [Elusimicrobiales bacterium]
MNIDIFKNKKILSIFVITIFITIALTAGFYILSFSQMEPLYYNLSEEDAAKIVEKLKEMSIKYELRNNGKTILVDSSKVLETRLMLASQGLPSKSETGFELFDKTKLGLSGFVERINYRRALEGELSRTISSINGIKFAKVHIALPEPDIFTTKTKAASASIIIHLSNGFNLSESQIKGIVNLVAGAVEGLNPQNISITDGNGRLIKSNGEDNTEFNSDIKKSIEKNIEEKVKIALEKIAGSNNFVVTADVVLDLDVLETIKEIYNPNPVIRSSQNISEEISSQDTKTKKTSSDTKYEMDKTIEKYIKKSGTIKKISLSVVVSTKVVTDLENIREIASTAAGIDLKRGDTISVKMVPFIEEDNKKDNISDEEYLKFQKDIEKQKTIREIIKYSIISLGWLIFGFFVFLAVKFLSKSQEKETVTQPFLTTKNNTSPLVEEKNQLQQTQKIDLKKEFIEKASKNPEVVSEVLKEYLNQPKNREVVNAS